MKYEITPFNSKFGSWVTVKCADEDAYFKLHMQLDNIEHICNKSELTLYINAVDFLKIKLDVPT